MFWNVPNVKRKQVGEAARVIVDSGQSRVTIVDIARAAGVSKSTVSLVLQASPLVNEQTRAKVNAAIRELGYVYHRGAANLRKNVSDVVGMVINDLTNPFFAEMTVGLESALQAAGLVPFLANTGENPERQAEVMRTMREHGALGYILCPAIGTDNQKLAEIEAWGLPVVTVIHPARRRRITVTTGRPQASISASFWLSVPMAGQRM